MADTLNVYREQDNLTPPASGGGGKLILTILGLCVLLGGLAWFALDSAEHETAPAVVDAGVPAAPPKPTLPSPSESDPRVRTLLTSISADPKWMEYLKQTDLVRVFVAATDNIAAGDSPRTRLFFLAPTGKFETVEKADKKKKTKTTFIAPASFARYDAVAAVVGSMDEKAVAAAYKELAPWIALAYEEIGPRNSKFETVWQRAVTRLTAVPVPTAELAVVPKGLQFAFADPALEALSAAEKHLLRMGPKNQKIIQTKLLAISDAIGSGGATDGGMADSMGDGGTMGGSMGDSTGASMDGGAMGGTTPAMGGTTDAGK